MVGRCGAGETKEGREKMIRFFNDRFEFERDKYQWILHEYYEGKDKDGNPKVQRRTTFHGKLEQVIDNIVDRSCGEGVTICRKN
jgi:hypothetical protein